MFVFAMLAVLVTAGGAAQSSDSVSPFLKTQWRQDSPFNDLMPVVVEHPDSDDVYRGRAPCGCVATALAQVMRAWEWPFCAGEIRTSKHSVSKGSVMDKGIDIYLRVDARAPFNWDAMGVDGSGSRFETARLLLWIDSLVEMMFARTGSGADIDDFKRSGVAWFEPYENVPRYASNFAEKIVAELKRGYPVAMMIPGHQVVADGWRCEDGVDYVHLNHGWGGKDDGWYPLQGNDMIIQSGQLIHPIRTVQIEPLPVECETTVALRWHVPRLYSREIEGFVITESEDGCVKRTFEMPPAAREFSVCGLEVGHSYAYAVTPLMDEAVTSESVQTLSVSSVRPRPVLADVSRVCLPREGGSFEVVGENVASLGVYPSHISYLSDSDCLVERGESGLWTVRLSPRVQMPNRQNVILTLVATALSGESVVRDVPVHFGDMDSVAIDLSSFRIVSFRLDGEVPVFETNPTRSELEEAGYSIFLHGASSLEPAIWEESLKSSHRFFKAIARPSTH